MSDLVESLWRRYYRSPGVVQDHRLAARFDQQANFAGRRLPLLASLQRRWTIGEWSPGSGVQLRYRALPAGEAESEPGTDARLKYPNLEEPRINGETGEIPPTAQIVGDTLGPAGSFAPNHRGESEQPGGVPVAPLTSPTGKPLVVARKINRPAEPSLEPSRFKAPAVSLTSPGTITSEKPFMLARRVTGLKTEPTDMHNPERATDQSRDRLSYPADLPEGLVDISDSLANPPWEMDRSGRAAAGQPVAVGSESSQLLWLSRQVDRRTETPPGIIRSEEPIESQADRLTYAPDGLNRLTRPPEYPASQPVALNRGHLLGTGSVQRAAAGPLLQTAPFNRYPKPRPAQPNGFADDLGRSPGGRADQPSVAPERLPLSRLGPTIARNLSGENPPVRHTVQDPQEANHVEAGPEIDLDGLAEQVWRILERRLAVERERRGMGR